MGLAMARRLPDDVVTAALQGDTGSLDRLVGDWLPQIYRWCARLGGPQVDAEEAAHDVLMLLVRRRASITGPRVLPSWLFAACRNVTANHRRRAWVRRWIPGKRPLGIGAPEHDPVEVEAPGVESLVEERELAAKVAGVLEGLADAHREVLVLCYLEDRSIDEASDLLGVPPGTVKSRLFAARKKFEARFDRAEGGR
jgi:RNA polymerase sigma-70 factor (ECF subfamily)